MHSDIDCMPELEEKIAENALEKKQLQDVTTLVAELRHLLVRHNKILKQEHLRKEILKLENWLEAERNGPAPAEVISESGIAWLSRLRDQLKLSADEVQRLESEGGPPSSKEQVEKTEELLKAIRGIDKIITENTITDLH